MHVLAQRGLVPHPDQPHPPISLGTKLSRLGSGVLKIEFVVMGELGRLAFPALASPQQADKLWLHTCFEVFVGRADGGYFEYNFSPDRRWAVYEFESYRSGMYVPSQLGSPDIYVEQEAQTRLALTAYLDLSSVWDQAFKRIGLSAVIEEKSGRKSYWSLAHPPEGPPDFHHPACFALELPPAPGA